VLVDQIPMFPNTIVGEVEHIFKKTIITKNPQLPFYNCGFKKISENLALWFYSFRTI
jgi:hypothetical protein